jgi:hypothetical protein
MSRTHLGIIRRSNSMADFHHAGSDRHSFVRPIAHCSGYHSPSCAGFAAVKPIGGKVEMRAFKALVQEGREMSLIRSMSVSHTPLTSDILAPQGCKVGPVAVPQCALVG